MHPILTNLEIMPPEWQSVQPSVLCAARWDWGDYVIQQYLDDNRRPRLDLFDVFKGNEGKAIHRAMSLDGAQAWVLLDLVASKIADAAGNRVDAERWRALMSSQRMHFMGSAGFDHQPKDGDPANRKLVNTTPIPRDGGAQLHFGMEFWDIYPQDDRFPDTFERELLTVYVDALRARMAPTEDRPAGPASPEYLAKFPEEARPHADRAYQDGYEDGANSPAAGIKPLEWEGDEEDGECAAPCIFGEYRLVGNGDTYNLLLSYVSGQQLYQTLVAESVGLDEGKEIAQVNYAGRMEEVLA